MNLDSHDAPDKGDRRLAAALHLLEAPARKPPSTIGPLLASAGLAGMATLLAVMSVFGPARDRPAVSGVAAAPASSAPGFELSGHAISADAAGRVVAGSEGAR